MLYLPARYRDWKREAIASLTLQAFEIGLELPLNSATVTISLVGKHPRRGDPDNIAGSILDALVQSGILKDDSLSVVTSLAIALFHSKDNPTVQITLKRPS